MLVSAMRAMVLLTIAFAGEAAEHNAHPWLQTSFLHAGAVAEKTPPAWLLRCRLVLALQARWRVSWTCRMKTLLVRLLPPCCHACHLTYEVLQDAFDHLA